MKQRREEISHIYAYIQQHTHTYITIDILQNYKADIEMEGKN